jgi:phosphoserine phosphatase
MQRMLFTVTGTDKPGITASLTEVLADYGCELLDVEQVVVQGQLTLCLLVAEHQALMALPRLEQVAGQNQLVLQSRVIEVAESQESDAREYAVTAIGDAVDARGVHLLTSVLSTHRANIEKIQRLSDGHLSSLEILISLPVTHEIRELRRDLMTATAELKLDIAVQRDTLARRNKRLVVMDMDSTLIQIEFIDELARARGVFEQVAEVTRAAMAGELVFEQSLRKRVALLKGMPVTEVMKLAYQLPVTEGAPELLRALRALGYKTAVISGGFTLAANVLKEQLGLDYAFANQLEVRDGVLTGQVVEPIVGAQRKADLLDTLAQRESIPLEQTIAVGDGANDLPMLERAGLGIAFHGKPKLCEAADMAIRRGGLDRILYLLGLRERDVRTLLGG